MVPVRCLSCATSFTSHESDAICPSCGAVIELSTPPVRPAPDPLFSIRIVGSAIVLAIALVPLIVLLFSGADDTEDRYRRTIESNPDVVLKLEGEKEVTLHDVLVALPDGRIEGAHLSVDSRMHWAYAGVSAIAFLTLILVVIPWGRSGPSSPIFVALFTGTVGIALLLMFQNFAEATQGYVSSNPVVLIIKMIGHSYRAAQDPNAGFVFSLRGFTFGVGLCEELLKALPIYWHFKRTSSLDWRGALMWGVASGVGFGVTEGIFYSADFYNGLAGGGTYIVRFVSCVALHSVWTAAVALTIWEDQESIFQADSFLELAGTVPGVLFIPMLLHALYDTFLKRGPEWVAAIVALASVAWLVHRLNRARSLEAGEPSRA